MKKLFAIVLAVVMVLGIATSAMAFSWAKPADSDKVNFGYEIDVVKFTRSTAALGSSSFNADDNATAVNGADVYFAIKLTIADPDKAGKVTVSATSIENFTGIKDLEVPTTGVPNGVYYYCDADQNFFNLQHFAGETHTANKVGDVPVYALTCLDTASAKVTAKITAKTDLTQAISCGGYDIYVQDTTVTFTDGTNILATFTRDADGKVTGVTNDGDTQKVAKLYAWLNAGSVDAIYNAIKNGEMYMTDDNIIAAFGYNFKSEDTVTWNANSTPIILDPTVSIPKTGDNASVVGFAMIMVAIVAAAVAVKKVNA